MDIIYKIQEILAQKDIKHYRINKSVKKSTELFYIKRELDITRSTDITDCSVTVYRDFEANGIKMRGHAAAMIFPDMTDEEISKTLSDAYYAASFVKNKYYELPQKSNKHTNQYPEAEYDLTNEAFKTAKALFSAEEPDSVSFINSCEVFARRSHVRIVTSEGIDVQYVKYTFNGEFVAQAVSNGQDVELHTQFSYGEPPEMQLTEKVRHALKTVKDRAEAVSPPPSGKYSVILVGEDVSSVLGYYVSRTQGGMIYAGYSSFKKGCLIQGESENFTSERLQLNLKATHHYSAEGIPMKDRILTKDGKLETIHCGARFAHYLDIEPTGDYSSVECLNGTESFEDMKASKNKVLLISSFSDFQTDAFTGQFGGEIRLAYLFE